MKRGQESRGLQGDETFIAAQGFLIGFKHADIAAAG
jgi:hypothetical protein